MKKITSLVWLLTLCLALTALAFPFAAAALQIPTGQLVSGSTSGGVVYAVRVDANGVVSVNNTLGGTAASANNGTADAGTVRVAVASDNTPFKVRNTPAMTGYTTDYNSGFVVLPNTPTTLTSTATLVQSFYCANATAAAIQMVTTSGAFAWIGTTAGVAGYSIPAYSNVRFVSDQLGMFTTNIGWYSVTTSGIVCQIAGKQ